MTNRGIYPSDLAARFKDIAGQKYRPSNGTEGMIFDDAWCSHCKRDAAWRIDEQSADPCPILSDSFAYEVDALEYPTEWQFDADGQPCCTAFEDINTPEPPDPNQLALPLP